jgi:hypothetical protein
VLLAVVLAVAVEFVALQSMSYTIDERALLAAVAPAVRWGLLAALVVVPVVAVALLVRRAGVATALRVTGVAAALGVLFQSDGNQLWSGTDPLSYGPLRWIALPLLAFALPVLAARLVDRRASRRRAVDVAGGLEGGRG